MEDKELSVDLNNLTKEDFLEMAKYIHHLEGVIGQLQANVEQLKTYCMTLKAQRVSADNKVASLNNALLQATITQQPTITTIDITDSSLDLINPEQYQLKQQF
jgi:hypothetical protein